MEHLQMIAGIIEVDPALHSREQSHQLIIMASKSRSDGLQNGVRYARSPRLRLPARAVGTEPLLVTAFLTPLITLLNI